MGGRHAVALFPVVLTVAGPCLAEDTFRTEAGLSYSKLSSDTERQKTAGVDATYYFDNLPSQPSDTPYEQVPFVERVGGVSANYALTSSDRDNVERLGNGYDYGAAVQFAVPQTFFRAAAVYEFLKFGRERQAGQESESEVKAYRASIGAYVAKTTAVDLIWSRSKTTTTFSNSGSFDVTVDSVGLSGQHLARLPSGGHVAINASVTQLTLKSEGLPTEKNREFLVQAIYYPTKMLGLKLGIMTDRGDEDSLEGEHYILGIRSFFTSAFSLSLDYEKFSAKTSGNDFDAIMLRGALRF